MKTILHKRLFCIVLACFFLQLCLPLQQIGGIITTVFAAEEENVYDFAGGTGTAENPYKVETMFHLNNVRHYLDAHFIQMNDIDLTEATADNGILGAWQSIGTSSEKFTGSYDGDGNVIKGLQGNSLFGYIDENGVVENLAIVDGKVVSNNSGGIAGENKGIISNCYNSSNITSNYSTGSSYLGGIVGRNIGIINNCYNNGNITPSHAWYSYSGGIAGENKGTISNCYNSGNISNSSYNSYSGYNGLSSSYGIGGISGRGIKGGIVNSYTLDIVNSNEYGITLTIEEMKQKNNFVGFDFDTIWTYDSTNKYQFPILKNIKHIEKKENIIDFNGGNGTLYNPYIISTLEHLNNIKNYTNDCFIQISNIDITENEVHRIGTFSGNYNGNNYNINGLTKYSLFSVNNGIIQNINMIDCNIITTSNMDVGGIVVTNYGIINNCNYNGNINVHYGAGGIVNSNYGIISNCYNAGNITSEYDPAGGIAGENAEGIIINCYNTGDITNASYYCETGGIAGTNTGIINHCYNTGIVSAVSSNENAYAGGIVGYNRNMNVVEINNCYNTGMIISHSDNNIAYAGGLVGYTIKKDRDVTISTSYSIGEVSATGATTRVGKVIGMNEGTTLSHLYYIGTSSDIGIGNEGNGKDRVEFRTAEQMKTPSSLTGFDFDTIWAVDEGINNGFPFLYGVGNSLTPPSELPEGTLERSIKNLSYDSGKQAYTFTIAFKNTTGNAITTNVFAAAYDDSGRMTGLAIYDLTDLAAGSGTTIDAVIPAPQTAAYIKVICMDSNTLAPVGMALKEEM